MFSWPESALWAFSLEYYQRNKVKDALLHLQNVYGANVNLLLLCVWVAKAFKQTLSADHLHAIEKSIDEWHQQIVVPARSVRSRLRQIKLAQAQIASLSVILGDNMLEQEINAEHIEQLMLEKEFLAFKSELKPCDSTNSALQQSFEQYLQVIDVVADPQLNAQLLILKQAI